MRRPHRPRHGATPESTAARQHADIIAALRVLTATADLPESRLLYRQLAAADAFTTQQVVAA